MSYNACPLPDRNAPEPDAVRQLLGARRIAVVGMSDDPSKPSNYVAKYLMDHGLEVIPVNPNATAIHGQTCYPSLEDVPGHVDLVNVFRLPRFCPAIVETAVKVRAGGVWLQSGIVSPEAERIATEAGLPFVQDRCLMVEHSRHTR
jgi:predicted CoA-binding protein